MTTDKAPFMFYESWDAVSSGYETDAKPFLELYSKEAIAKSGVSSSSSVLDLACGPGTLSLMISSSVKKVTALDFSPYMIKIFKSQIEKENLKNIELVCSDGMNASFENEQFDHIFSMFGLMFFPDIFKAMKNCYSWLKSGGEFIISSWTPVIESPLMLVLFKTLAHIRGEDYNPVGNYDSLENKDFFFQQLNNSGFSNITIDKVTKEFLFDNTISFWDSMERGSIPIVLYKNCFNKEAWQSKRKMAISYISEELGNKPRILTSNAWLARAVKV